jgi:Flp pilus assembly protein TadD
MVFRSLLACCFLLATAWAQPAPPSAQEREAGFLFRQGLELLDQGQFQRATDLFRQSLRLEPERLEIRPYLARSLFEAGDFEPALRQLELYLDKEPQDAKVALFRVRVLTALERYGQASDALGLLALTYGENSWEWQNLQGFLAEKQERYELAEQAYQKAAELARGSSPGGARSYEPETNLVTLYLRQDNLEKATAIVTELLAQAPEDPGVLNAFALLLAAKEQGFDPAPLIAKLKDQSLPFELQYNLAAALAERGANVDAGVLAGDLVDRNPEDARAAWLYGRILLAQRELQDAGEFLLAARDRLPLTTEIAATMGTYSYLIGDYREAERWFAEAMTRDPENGLWPHNLSLALSRLDKLEEAIAASSEALRLQKNDPRVIYQLALVLDRNGDIEQAIEAYQRFLEKNEDPEQASVVREHLAELKPKR